MHQQDAIGLELGQGEVFQPCRNPFGDATGAVDEFAAWVVHALVQFGEHPLAIRRLHLQHGAQLLVEERRERFAAERGPVILISNSPRPSSDVELQLDQLRVPRGQDAASHPVGDHGQARCLDEASGLVLRAARERLGRPVTDTREANPGEVWEENEFWIELSWRIDPDGSLGIRQYHESKAQPGTKLSVDEYYGWMFEHSVPGLPEAASAEGLTPLQFMRRYGAFEIRKERGQVAVAHLAIIAGGS